MALRLCKAKEIAWIFFNRTVKTEATEGCNRYKEAQKTTHSFNLSSWRCFFAESKLREANFNLKQILLDTERSCQLDNLRLESDRSKESDCEKEEDLLSQAVFRPSALR